MRLPQARWLLLRIWKLGHDLLEDGPRLFDRIRLLVHGPDPRLAESRA